MLPYQFVKIIAAQIGVAVSAQYVKHTVSYTQYGYIKCAAA